MGGISYALAWYWFGWRLSLIIFLFEYSNNLLASAKKKEKKEFFKDLGDGVEKELKRIKEDESKNTENSYDER